MARAVAGRSCRRKKAGEKEIKVRRLFFRLAFYAPAWLAPWLIQLGWRALGREKNQPFRDE